MHVHVSTAEEIVKAIVMAEEAGQWDTVLTLIGELDRPLSLARKELGKCLSLFSFLPPSSKLTDRLSKVESRQQSAKAKSLRAKGKELYIMATSSSSSKGKHHSWKISTLTEAIQNFAEGKQIASRADDKVEWLYCARSIGAAYSFLAKEKEFQFEKGADWTVNNFISALTAFSEIITDHRNIEDKEWQELVFNQLSSTITAAIEYCKSIETSWSKRCFLLERLLHLEEGIGDSACYARVHVLVSAAEEIVKAIENAEEAGEWGTVSTLLLKAREQLEKCRSLFPPIDKELWDSV